MSDDKLNQVRSAIVSCIEEGGVDLSERLKHMFLPARRVTITCGDLYVENGQVIVDVVFKNSLLECTVKVVLVPTEIIEPS